MYPDATDAERGSGSKYEVKEPMETVKREEFQMPHQKRRGCTDIFCIIIFAVFCIVQALVCVIGYTYGNPLLLIAAKDSNGSFCGIDKEVKEMPYLIYFDLIECAQMGAALLWSGCPTPQVCVTKCPQEYFHYLVADAMEQAADQGIFRMLSFS